MYELKESKDKLIFCMTNTILDVGIVKSFEIKVVTTWVKMGEAGDNGSTLQKYWI